jgi:mono/diheme cytochrome c family protein
MSRCLRVSWVGAAILLGILLVSIPAVADSIPTRPLLESYLLHCSGCHRLDGSGVPGVAPDLREIGPLLETPAGRAYLGRVPGVAQAPIDDEELASLLNWVLTEIAKTAPQPVYTAKEVGILRAEPLRDPVAARRALQAPDAPES